MSNLTWTKNSRLHREDGPAVITENGEEFWYLDGKRHRDNGPARLFPDGRKEWWVNGERIHTTKRFKADTGISDEELDLIILKYGPIK